MKDTMKVAVMTDIQKMSFEQRPVPQPQPDEVLVELEYVGICGSDLHYYEHGRIGDFVVETPYVLGHEASGKVVQLGSEVTDLKIGDRVALEPGITCGKCEFCITGRYNLCPDVIFFATPPVPGVFQEYVAHKASLCFKLPENVSSLEGALIEPLAVGFHAANQGGAHAGQTAVVFGSGCIGLTSVLALRALGLTKIYIIDNLNNRLDKAVELGATAGINFVEKNPVDTVMELTEGKGCDIVIETSGSEIAASQAIDMAKKGSSIVMVGYSASGMVNVPMSNILNKELNIASVFRYRHIYPMAIESVAGGNINLKDLATHIFDFDDVEEAMNKSIADKANIVKAAVKIK